MWTWAHHGKAGAQKVRLMGKYYEAYRMYLFDRQNAG